jgi:hypothetical protein
VAGGREYVLRRFKTDCGQSVATGNGHNFRISEKRYMIKRRGLYVLGSRGQVRFICMRSDRREEALKDQLRKLLLGCGLSAVDVCIVPFQSRASVQVPSVEKKFGGRG